VSLRLRLVLLVLGLTTVLLGGLGLYVGASLRVWTLEVVDAELGHRADLLAYQLRLEEGRLELPDADEDDAVARVLTFRVEAEDGSVLAGAGTDWPAATSALPPEGLTTLDGRGGKPLRVLSRPFRPRRGHDEQREHSREGPGYGEALVLRVAAPLTAFSVLADRFRDGLLVALALASLLGAAGAALLAQVLLAPLRRLVRAVDGIGASSLQTRLDPAGLDPDLSRLAVAFNGVLGRLAEAFAAQRAFVGRASHALRTPLASILSQAEVALLKDREPQAYRQALGAVAEAARDASGLADGLLALTRADALETGERPARLRLDQLADELSRLFGPRAEAAGLRFSARAAAGLELVATRGRVREMVDALLDNALRYTPREGAVQFEARAEEGRVVLEVLDTGPGVRPEERAQVFERFYRGSAATGTGQRGSGLGLAVVQALAAAEGAEVSLDEAPGGGTRVRLSYPADGALTRPAGS
jgi:signal transduction histidine kinase